MIGIVKNRLFVFNNSIRLFSASHNHSNVENNGILNYLNLIKKKIL